MIRCYIRVSTDEQGDSGLGLEAQRRALYDRFPAGLIDQYQETASAKDLDRPILCNLLGALSPGDTLAVAKLDRLTRSVVDFGQLLEAAKAGGWFIVALDLGVDTSTPTGELVANIMVSVSQWERRIIGQRTKEALAERKANGQTLGRPVEISPEAEEIIRELFVNGHHGCRYITRKLTEAKIKPPRGDAWYPSTVLRVIDRLGLEDNDPMLDPTA
jgi:DNA invertase Pin-like site-specific DNA recombinase